MARIEISQQQTPLGVGVGMMPGIANACCARCAGGGAGGAVAEPGLRQVQDQGLRAAQASRRAGAGCSVLWVALGAGPAACPRARAPRESVQAGGQQQRGSLTLQQSIAWVGLPLLRTFCPFSAAIGSCQALLPRHAHSSAVRPPQVAKLHLPKRGVELTTLTPKQAAYINVPIEGPFKPLRYRY
jgi:hypothetical protein